MHSTQEKLAKGGDCSSKDESPHLTTGKPSASSSSQPISSSSSSTSLTPREVEALYETLEWIIHIFGELEIPYTITAGGTLLGAIRQHSLLFCDDDIDIAILETSKNKKDPVDHYSLRFKDYLCRNQNLLNGRFQYQPASSSRPWDRIRPIRMNNVFVDVFTIRQYRSIEDLRSVIGWKQNKLPQSNEYVQTIENFIFDALYNGMKNEPDSLLSLETLFPLWHFSCRKAIELWPREVFRSYEIFPIQQYFFGHLSVPGPHLPLTILYRSFGTDCLDFYVPATRHNNAPKQEQYSATNAPLEANATTSSQRHLPPKVLSTPSATKLPLQDRHFVPLVPKRYSQAIPRPHNRKMLHDYVDKQTVYEQTVVRTNCLSPDEKATRVVYMDGIFDMFHVGHLQAIEQCAALGGVVVVGVTGDDDATAYKRRPIISQDDRARLVQALPQVHRVVCPCPLVVSREFMEEHNIDLVVHGFANPMDATKQLKEFFQYPVETGRFQEIQYTASISTTDIIHRILEDYKNEPKEHIENTGANAPKRFGDAMKDALSKQDDPTHIPYDPFPLSLRVAIDPILEKAREARARALEQCYSRSEIETLVHEQCGIYDLNYDTTKYNLRRAFERAAGVVSVKEAVASGEKDAVLCAFRRNYQEFQQVYDQFVREVCLPHHHEMVMGNRTAGNEIPCYYDYQAFPCLRWIRPGEFSIGPHADVAYGHSARCWNYYISLLEDSEQLPNVATIWTERRFGSEDWVPLLNAPSSPLGCAFPGGLLLHWTCENTSAQTRLTLDFRIIRVVVVADGEEPGRTSAGQAYRTGGYYRRAAWMNGAWQRVFDDQGDDDDRTVPDARMGYPWTIKNFDSS